jgi:hypothetical protein
MHARQVVCMMPRVNTMSSGPHRDRGARTHVFFTTHTAQQLCSPHQQQRQALPPQHGQPMCSPVNCAATYGGAGGGGGQGTTCARDSTRVHMHTRARQPRAQHTHTRRDTYTPKRVSHAASATCDSRVNCGTPQGQTNSARRRSAWPRQPTPTAPARSAHSAPLNQPAPAGGALAPAAGQGARR